MPAQRMNNLNGKEWLQNSFTIWRELRKNSVETKLKHPAMFPQALVEKLINIYTKDEGEVILDPFLGSGSTVLGAMATGKKGIGIELSPKYFELIQNRINSYSSDLFEERKIIEPSIFNDDAINLLKYVPEESVDLVLTSPPYWDILNMKRTVDNNEIRNYSDDVLDLGNIEDYDEFLENLKKVFTNVFKVLKPNKRCISVVMDIRKKDKFYPLHIDQTRIMQEIGFELEEFVIWDRQHEYNNMKTLGYPYVFRFNKVHEYICVYWKREVKTKKKKQIKQPALNLEEKVESKNSFQNRIFCFSTLPRDRVYVYNFRAFVV